ncbi:MAG: hypothetical protein ACJ761_07295, partial [Chloroflexota bacterium]
MTAILRTPSDWPAILLPAGLATARATAAAADPVDLDAARDRGAFVGLRRATHDLGPSGTVAVIAASGLRGRGGSGFPTGEKWRAAAAAPGS